MEMYRMLVSAVSTVVAISTGCSSVEAVFEGLLSQTITGPPPAMFLAPPSAVDVARVGLEIAQPEEIVIDTLLYELGQVTSFDWNGDGRYTVMPARVWVTTPGGDVLATWGSTMGGFFGFDGSVTTQDPFFCVTLDAGTYFIFLSPEGADLSEVFAGVSRADSVQATDFVLVDGQVVDSMPSTDISFRITFSGVGVQIVDACGASDLAAPLGTLDLADIDAFVAAFLTNAPPADLVAPAGVLDLDDVDAFVGGYLSGCP